MINSDLYTYGKSLNLLTKYTIEKQNAKAYLCTTYLYSLLNSPFTLDEEQRNKIYALIDNLCILHKNKLISEK